MNSVYLETSVISHAASRPSRDQRLAILQREAREWWQFQRRKFELFSSLIVINEASAGDPLAARERLTLMEGIPLVPINSEVQRIADQLLNASQIPSKAAIDVFHDAAAAYAGIDYLLTQNCRHLANAHILPTVYRELDTMGYGGLLICTPRQFLDGNSDVDESPT